MARPDGFPRSSPKASQPERITNGRALFGDADVPEGHLDGSKMNGKRHGFGFRERHAAFLGAIKTGTFERATVPRQPGRLASFWVTAMAVGWASAALANTDRLE